MATINLMSNAVRSRRRVAYTPFPSGEVGHRWAELDFVANATAGDNLSIKLVPYYKGEVVRGGWIAFTGAAALGLDGLKIGTLSDAVTADTDDDRFRAAAAFDGGRIQLVTAGGTHATGGLFVAGGDGVITAICGNGVYAAGKVQASIEVVGRGY